MRNCKLSITTLIRTAKTRRRKISREGLFFFFKNWMVEQCFSSFLIEQKKCGQAAIIFNIINNPVLPGRSKFSSLHAGKYTYCVAYIFPCLRLHLLVLFNKYFNFKLSNNNGNSELGIISDTCTDTQTLRQTNTH